KMLVGNGAGYSQLDKLRATFGNDIDNFCNIDPVPAQLLNPASLAPGLGDLTKMMVERYKAKTNATDVPPHCSMGFNQTWILLNNVLPIAKEKYGGFDAEAVRKAALDVDIPPGGTIQGYGVKFYPPGTQLSGQNERSTPVVMQNAGEHISVVSPTQHQDPGAGPAVARLVDLRHALNDAGRNRPFPALRRIPGGQPGVLRRQRRGNCRPHRTEWIGQEHDLQPDRRHAASDGRLDPVPRRRHYRPAGAPDLPSRDRAHVPNPASLSQAVAHRQRDARGPL